jgi:hypothetical protein
MGAPCQWDPRGALRDLLNIPDSTRGGKVFAEAAKDFIARYGALRILPHSVMKPTDDQGVVVGALAWLFRQAWAARDGGETGRIKINTALSAIFTSAKISGENRAPGLKVDILAGTIEPVPRDLLDAMAVEFMRSYRTIGQCERCTKFFFKTYANDRYCSPLCGDASRREQQRDSMRRHRAEQKQKKELRQRKTRRAS